MAFTGTWEEFNSVFHASLSTVTASGSLLTTAAGLPITSQRKTGFLALTIFLPSHSTKVALQQKRLTSDASADRPKYRTSASVLQESIFHGTPCPKKKQCSSLLVL